MKSLFLLFLIAAVYAKTVELKTGNFYQTIFDPDSEVFLKVYAPWCGHCKALAPTWTELEKLYEKNDKIIIGSLNAEENEMIARSIGVKGFPTILFYSREDKNEPIHYEGPRTVEAFTKYLDENAGLPVTHDK